MKRTKGPRLFTVLHINCDCASYDTVRVRWPPREYSFPKCDYCGRSLGDMQYKVLGRVRATNFVEAIRAANNPVPPANASRMSQ
jgi:hypothetical protein